MEIPKENYFLHADGDSFFVACELAMHPEYKGLPVIVGEDRGIAVAMSYEAKKLGVTRGMPVFKIRRQFPSVIILSHHFDLYKKISQGVYDILLSYVGEVEKYSIDECFAVVKPSDIRFAGSAEKLLREIKDEIQNTLGVTFSLGLARTKALAKTASKLEKPNGIVILMSELAEEKALQKTSIDDIWGIGRRTIPRLMSMGMRTAYDFGQYSEDSIQRFFSEPLVLLQRELRGQSFYPMHSHADPRDQKSIQSTATFKPSSSEAKTIFAELSENVERACEHARRLNLMTNSVSFFVKTSEFSYHGDGSALELYTTNPSDILNSIEPKLYALLKRGEKIRSTGITLHNLRREEDVPQDLFGIQHNADTKNTIEKVSDLIRNKFGRNSLKRASSLKVKHRERGNSFPGTN